MSNHLACISQREGDSNNRLFRNKQKSPRMYSLLEMKLTEPSKEGCSDGAVPARKQATPHQSGLLLPPSKEQTEVRSHSKPGTTGGQGGPQEDKASPSGHLTGILSRRLFVY